MSTLLPQQRKHLKKCPLWIVSSTRDDFFRVLSISSNEGEQNWEQGLKKQTNQPHKLFVVVAVPCHWAGLGPSHLWEQKQPQRFILCRSLTQVLPTCSLPACVLCGHGWWAQEEQWSCGPEPGIQAMRSVEGGNDHVRLASPLCPVHSLISPRNTSLQYHLPSAHPRSWDYRTMPSVFLLRGVCLILHSRCLCK